MSFERLVKRSPEGRVDLSKVTQLDVGHKISLYGTEYHIRLGENRIGAIKLRTSRPSMLELLRGDHHSLSTNAAYVSDFEIYEPHRRNGFGRQTLNVVERVAVSNDLPYVRACAYDSDHVANEFLFSCNYEKIGTFGYYKINLFQRNVRPFVERMDRYKQLNLVERTTRHKDGKPYRY